MVAVSDRKEARGRSGAGGSWLEAALGRAALAAGLGAGRRQTDAATAWGLRVLSPVAAYLPAAVLHPALHEHTAHLIVPSPLPGATSWTFRSL